MNLEKLLMLMHDVGVDPALLEQASGDWTVRADLALSSAETTAVFQKLKDETGISAPLWDEDDLTLNALVEFCAS